MIHFVTTRQHGYTVKHLIERQGARRCSSWSYEDLLSFETLPTGTWVFTDHERLSALQTQLTARIAGKLREGGARVLNDPALVRSRLEILRRLEQAGINRFHAYRAESGPRPSRFPVFIRNSFDHDARHLRLIEDQTTLDADLERIEAGGESLIGKLVIEYCGEEFVPGVWRRFATYCVAGRLISHHVGFDARWIVKDGFTSDALEEHPHREQLLSLESEFVTANRYQRTVAEAFALARIDYGRADFSLVEDRVQIYEINTNPNHASESEVMASIHPRRRLVQKRSEDELQQAIGQLDRRRPLRRLAQTLGLARKEIQVR